MSPSLRRLSSVGLLHQCWPTPPEMNSQHRDCCSVKSSYLRKKFCAFPNALPTAEEPQNGCNIIYPLRVAGLPVNEFATLYGKELAPQDVKPISICGNHPSKRDFAKAQQLIGDELQFARWALDICGLEHKLEESSIDQETSNKVSHKLEMPTLVRTVEIELEGEPQIVVVSV